MTKPTKQRSFLFIYNPNSGKKDGKFLHYFEQQKHLFKHCELVKTKYRGHAYELTRKHHSEFDVVVAVGGDGTINEVASALYQTKTALGIVPQGSGNGLARHLGITPQTALQQLLKGSAQSIDMVKLNDKLFINVAGLGFDGHISYLFNQSQKRGFISYLLLSVKEYFSFNPFAYELIADTTTSQGKAFVIALANSSQYGNNFIIAPRASVADGKLQVLIFKKPKIGRIPLMVWRIFRGKPLPQRDCLVTTASQATIYAPGQRVHIDGEVAEINSHHLQAQVVPACLQVIC